MYRKTFAIIDGEKIESNIKKIIKEYGEYKYYFGVVKANAYGHGIESIKYMINGGINYLAVSSLEEALEIRKIDKKIPVLILEPISYEAAIEASKNNLTITIDNVKYFKQLLNDKIKLKFHLKIDTGMNRFGLKTKEDVTYIYKHANDDLYLEGIYSHLASGVDGSSLFNNEINTFKDLTADIDLNKVDIIGLDRSLTIEQHQKIAFANGIRLGIIMYGFNKIPYVPSLKRKIFNKLTFRKTMDTISNLKLETALEFKTTVIEIKNVKKGEIVGYGGMYVAPEDIKIAILPYGFADYLFINKSMVVINHQRYPIITNYMDVTSVLIDDNVNAGDEVEIFGNEISIREASRWANQNVYKVLTSITNRVPRVYKYHKKETEIKY
jgi:alanine racemase